MAHIVVASWHARDERRLQQLAGFVARNTTSESSTLARATVAHALWLATGNTRHAVEALDDLERLRQEPGGRSASSSAYLFDRAVVLADLGLCHLAASAFALAAAREQDGAWQREAEQRAAALPCAEVQPPDTTLDSHLDEVFDRLLLDMAPSLPRADRVAFDRLRALGADLENAGEPLVAAVAAELADESRLQDARLRRAIAGAAAGRQAFVALDFDGARRDFEASCGILATQRSPLVDWCRYWLLCTQLYFGELDQAATGLAELRGTTASPYLRGRAAWAEGLALLRHGELGGAHDRLVFGARELARIHLARSHAAVEVLRAEVLSQLGAWEQAANVRQPAIVALQAEQPYFALLNALIDGARDASLMGFQHAAASYLGEAALLARQQGNVVSQTEVRLLQGELALEQDRRLRPEPSALASSRRYFLAARELAAAISGPLIRDRHLARAELGLAEAGDAAARTPAALFAVADYFAANGPRSNELRALGQLVDIADKSGDAATAGRAYDRAYRLIAAQRATIRGIERDARFLASQRAFFDRAIEAALRRRDPATALALVADASPGAGLSRPTPLRVDVRSRGAGEVPSAVGDVPGDQVLLVYRFLDRRLVWWTVHDGELRHGALANAGRARTLIETLRASRGTPDERVLEEGYRLLLAAPLEGVPASRTLVVVPDGPLAAVPFAALPESASGVRLIERRPVRLAMNPETVHDDNLPKAARGLRAAVVGDPAFDRRQLPWLTRLPGALTEARQVAAVYGAESELVTGEDATVEALRRARRGAAVLHVAAHALSGSAGGDVALVLAADRASASSGLASAEELTAGGDSPDLVVLSACATLDSRASDGLIGLAGPFLAGGASAVVGTLWPVEDRELSDWLVELHRLVAHGVRASVALQRVQSRAASDGPCCRWAALGLVGDMTLTPRQPSAEGRQIVASRQRH